MRPVYNILIGKLEGNRTLGRPRRRWDEVGWKDVDWMHMVQDRTSGRVF
jgi:hypothetical protein